MNSIWTFGDSFTFGMGCRIDQGINDGGDLYFKKYYQDSYDIWPNILANQIGYDIKNLGKCGCSNDTIIDTIIDSFDLINQNDIVIIQKTYYERFDIPWSDSNEFVPQYKQFINGLSGPVLSKNTTHKSEIETAINFAVYFSSSKLYKERQDKRFYFLKKQLLTKVQKVYVWGIDDDFTKSIQTISQHSNFKFKDEHFSFIGHKQLANHIYSKLFDITDKKNMI